jgi:hypothetical protein
VLQRNVLHLLYAKRPQRPPDAGAKTPTTPRRRLQAGGGHDAQLPAAQPRTRESIGGRGRSPMGECELLSAALHLRAPAQTVPPLDNSDDKAGIAADQRAVLPTRAPLIGTPVVDTQDATPNSPCAPPPRLAPPQGRIHAEPGDEPARSPQGWGTHLLLHTAGLPCITAAALLPGAHPHRAVAAAGSSPTGARSPESAPPAAPAAPRASSAPAQPTHHCQPPRQHPCQGQC